MAPSMREHLARTWRWVVVLFRPTGRADPRAGTAAGVALAVPLLVGTWAGYPAIGASMTLPIILVAMPLEVAEGIESARILAVRTLTLAIAGILVWLIGTHTWLLVAAVTAAAVVGVFAPRVGVTGALRVLLIGITGTGVDPVVPGLAQLVGGVWASALLWPRWGRSPDTFPAATVVDARTAVRSRAAWSHAARLGVLVAAASSVLAAVDRSAGQAHWLITALLLTVRPTTQATRVRAIHRVVGNSIGGVVAALVLLAQPGPVAVALIVGSAGAVGYGARPAHYLYWALATPLLLLLLSDFSDPMPWYGAVSRAVLNVLGGLLALAATHYPWSQDPISREPQVPRSGQLSSEPG